jgi:hypothetical protein
MGNYPGKFLLLGLFYRKAGNFKDKGDAKEFKPGSLQIKINPQNSMISYNIS